MHMPRCLKANNDDYARKVEAIWRTLPQGAIVPGIGLPSQGAGVTTITHTMGGPVMKINGLASKSILANNGLYTFEITGGKWLNLYEVMIPDIPGAQGDLSTG